MITVYYSNPACRRNRNLRNMLKAKEIQYEYKRARHIMHGKKYPIVKNSVGVVFDYQQLTIMLVKDNLEELK